ncbi:uncharacterized protein LOC112554609 [Pomacea canaliculata]|uniref:uncharacterized protein LOC112554609 n=1 Tax=Pomacea canaliculata TaxID=400727 RepID=UPI000D72F467|nr:uncharacterized protein LOC112554609 [Pomacea canaliculata]
MNAKVLKGLTDADFKKFENKINMGQWKTLKEKCGNITLTTQGSGQMNVGAASPDDPSMTLPKQHVGAVSAEGTAPAASQLASTSAGHAADSPASHSDEYQEVDETSSLLGYRGMQMTTLNARSAS